MPPVATLAVSLTVKPLVEARFLIVVLPGLVMVAATALGGMAGTVVGIAAGLGLGWVYEKFIRPRWGDMVHNALYAGTPAPQPTVPTPVPTPVVPQPPVVVAPPTPPAPEPLPPNWEPH